MKYDFDHSLGKITMQLSKTLGRKLEEKFNQNGIKINPGHWSIISMLYQKKDMIQKEIGNTLSVDKVMITRLVDQLEVKRIIVRITSENDKRINHIHLPDSGRKLYVKLKPFAQETITEAFRGIDEKEIRKCIDLLNRVYSNLINSAKQTP